MRCALVGFLIVFLAGFVPLARAQNESPQARELRSQLEELQRRLDALNRAESSTAKVTEIGSSRGRSHAEDEPRLIVRIYDLSDLYSIAPAYRAQEPGDLQETTRPIFPEAAQAAANAAGLSGMGGFGGGGFGGGFFAVPSGSVSRHADRQQTLHQFGGGTGGEQAGSPRTSIDALIDTITTTISPDEWDEVGGPASITNLGASLIVSAPADSQDKIAALLDLFRKRWGSLRTVSLQASWLWLTEAQLAAALADRPAAGGATSAFGVLTDAAWQRLLEPAKAEGEPRPGYHAVLTCYNGQTVHALAGGQRLAVVGLTPVVGGKEENAAYQPETRAIQEGAALQVTPIVSRTAKYVVLDVHSRVNLVESPVEKAKPAVDAPVPAGAPVEQVAASLDRPALQSQRFSTTIRVPAGRPTLIVGMTLSSAGARGSSLYLFLTAHVQELRDDEGGAVQGDAPKEAAPPVNDAAKPKGAAK
jgi:hypothetical protein